MESLNWLYTNLHNSLGISSLFIAWVTPPLVLGVLGGCFFAKPPSKTSMGIPIPKWLLINSLKDK